MKSNKKPKNRTGTAKPKTPSAPPAPVNASVKPATSPSRPAPAPTPAVTPKPPPSAKQSTSLPPQKPPARSVKSSPSKPRSFNIPPILLEGDATPVPKAKGPGTRYALAPGASPSQVTSMLAPGELPEGYGTLRLFLAARDPHWVYASWDLTNEQQSYWNSQSREGHLILRVFANDETTPAVPELHVNPESRNWFVNVPLPETRYHAELGYYAKSGAWQSITRSPSTFTPPDAPTEQPAAVQFATIPVEVTFQQVVEKVQDFVSEHRPLLEAVIIAQHARKQEAEPSAASSHSGSPRMNAIEAVYSPEPAEPPKTRARTSKRDPIQETGPQGPPELPIRIEQGAPWTPQRVAALAQLIHIDSYRRVWMGSIEITELVRRQLEEEISSIAAADLAQQAAREAGPQVLQFGISSRTELAVPRQRKFWFKVNAELVLYGATEPDAQVTIADRTVKLRPDGTFSFRFALPDGRYDLPAVARSADGQETRAANLEFSRSTEYSGHVEPHPQDASLKSPRRENIQ